MRQNLGQKLAPYDIRPGQIPLLLCLWEQDGISQKHLLEKVHVEQPTLANTLKRMERDKLLRMERDPLDLRKCVYYLTERGQKVRSVVEAALTDVRDICEKGLSVNDLSYFRRILAQMNQQILADLQDPAMILADEVQ
ncbi:MarR family winged helix-turn-helix transcriptional regulator [Salidesulfovibrio onnuriiensis]|uniref:MarR family winged helix-turn-helix transcriptional regulator n=1 Tax=Salidesulfovibrio onnuriiensis TaxID=2583823 RepID=UPI00164EDE61|nr:MarR family winged helix-turn-helix transcriptional regulator [Salidesulfovibrio onnuriiensis]